MTRIPVHNIGTIGIVRDIPAHDLPPEAWSDGANVRFRDNKIVRFTGHAAVFDPPTVPPVWALNVSVPQLGPLGEILLEDGTDLLLEDGTAALLEQAEYLWAYCGFAKAYAVSDAVHTEITRVDADSVAQDYAAVQPLLWNGGILGGIPIFNNGVDIPQMWDPPAPGTKLVDLTNWPAALLAAVVRPFKNYLIALNLTISGAVHSHRYRWSDSADPGTVPGSWDITDLDVDAGEAELTDVQAGVIRDGLQLGDIFVIYKDRATHGLQFIGGQLIFRRYGILEQSGILSSQCVAPIPVGRVRAHFVATGEDVVVFDGLRAESLLDRKWRRFYANDIDSDNFDRSFVVANPAEREMWFCYPESGNVLPTAAIVWDVVYGTITKREVSSLSFIAAGALPSKAREVRLLGCDPDNTKLFELDTTNQFNGTNYRAFVERTGLGLVGQKRDGSPAVNFSVRKLATRIWIKATGSPFLVQIGAQEEVNDAVTWETAQTFTPGTDEYLDFCADGRLLAVRFESTTNVHWEVEGYELDVEPLGEF